MAATAKTSVNMGVSWRGQNWLGGERCGSASSVGALCKNVKVEFVETPLLSWTLLTSTGYDNQHHGTHSYAHIGRLIITYPYPSYLRNTVQHHHKTVIPHDS